jgi:hypothetical protein
VCVREKSDGEIHRWERGEREQEWDGRRREKVQEVTNTCGEMSERERRERGEIWSEDDREMDEREMEEERKNRQREEWGRVIKYKIKILVFGMDIFYLCMKS